MLNPFWKPRGSYVPWYKLKINDSVEGYLNTRRIYSGYVNIEEETLYDPKDPRCSVYLYVPQSTSRIYLGCYKRSTPERYTAHESRIRLYRISNVTKGKPRMANKLMSLIKLNKDQRRLQRVGIYDENGNLTEDGKEVMLNMLAKDNETKLVALVKDWKDDRRKGKGCDDE